MRIERHIFKNYLAAINNSVGSNLFRNFYASFDGVEQDTLGDGSNSCAYFATSILRMFGALPSTSATVVRAVEKMQEAGFQKVDAPEPGDVIVYEPIALEPDGKPQEHMGFYVGEEKAISHSAFVKAPALHDYLTRDSLERKIQAVYRCRHLMPDDIKEVE